MSERSERIDEHGCTPGCEAAVGRRSAGSTAEAPATDVTEALR